MNINEIAKKILHLRETKMTGFIMAGVLREELGFDGYGEALRRRWIEADMEQSGMVTISNNLGVIEDIRKLAAECKAKCGTCNKAKCDCEGRCDACEGEKCTCESQQQPAQEAVSETAHFFAQAHAFRRNAVSEVVGAPEANAAPGALAWEPEHEEFYSSRRPDYRKHFDQHHSVAGQKPEELEASWTAMEPRLRDWHSQNMFSPQGKHHSGFQSWRNQRQWERDMAQADARRQPTHPGLEIGVNDSMEVKVSKICESATLGLGRTGDAPDVPVPGLGAGSAQKTQQAPIQAQSPTSPARPQAVAIGSDVAVVEGGKQYVGKVSRTLPDGKYEISFAGDQPPVRRAYDKTEVSTAAASAVRQ